MNQLTSVTNTISTLQLLEIINGLRVAEGEKVIRNTDFLHRVKDELSDDQTFNESFVKVQTAGRPTDSYTLTLEQAMLVGMRESKGVRRGVLAKLKEMEASAPAFVIPQTLPDALRLAADLADKVQEQAKQIEADAPHVNFSKVVETSSGAIPIGVFAKLMGIKGLGTNQKARYRAH